MKYEVSVEQIVVHKHSNGDSWESTEIIKGEAENFEDVQTFMGLVTSIFKNVTVNITITATNKENKEK